MSEPKASSPPATQPKLSEEPGFFPIDLSRSESIKIPPRTPGLLAFLYFDGSSELVIKILMLDDLAKGFRENRPFSGRANMIAYCVFPEVNDPDLRMVALGDRLKLYTHLTEKYNTPQRSCLPGKIDPRSPR